jgi:hypothetical protein
LLPSPRRKRGSSANPLGQGATFPHNGVWEKDLLRLHHARLTEKTAAIILVAASCDGFAILVVTVAADPP